MGKQHNKVEKRKRRSNYLKRKEESLKAELALSKKSGKKKAPAKAKKADSVEDEVKEAAPAKKAAAKKAPAKKAAAKKAPAKKAAAKKAPAKKAAAKKTAKKKVAPKEESAEGGES
tara:strand:+ start:1191 stop:1538 length:348 start_codon:yes stop_codon:yes gene_type:complete